MSCIFEQNRIYFETILHQNENIIHLLFTNKEYNNTWMISIFSWIQHIKQGIINRKENHNEFVFFIHPLLYGVLDRQKTQQICAKLQTGKDCKLYAH